MDKEKKKLTEEEENKRKTDRIADVFDEVKAEDASDDAKADEAATGECGCDHSEGHKCKGEGRKAKARVAELEAELEAEKAKAAAYEDKFMRVSAEYENFRRRSKEEREAVYSEAVNDSLAELLPIIDNFKLAAVYDDPEKIAEGVKLILKNVPITLEKLGIEEFGKVGEEFDPTIHNAVMHEESEEYGENTISAVLQAGYKRGDKILRFAMVKVAN